MRVMSPTAGLSPGDGMKEESPARWAAGAAAPGRWHGWPVL